jgi:hypothetical protein
MSSQATKEPSKDTTRIGEAAANQPLSGVSSVKETFAVSGLGRGGYVRGEDAEKKDQA